MTRTRRSISAASAVFAVLALGACASVPDAANPAHWYRSTVDYFSGDDAEAEKKKKQEAERQKQRDARVEAQAKASAKAESDQAKREAETGEVAERLARPTSRGLLADTGSRARYATAVPRQSEDPGAPASRVTQSSPPAAAEPPSTPAPRAAVGASPPPPPPPAREVAAAPPRPSAAASAQAQAPRPTPSAPTQAQAPSPTPPAAREQPAPTPAPIAPPPQAKAEAAVAPPVTTRALTVEETYRASLAEQSRLPSAAAAGSLEPPDTLIVSSEGLETVRRTQRPSTTSAPPSQPTATRSPGALGGVALRPAGQVGGTADSKAIKIATIQFADGSSRLDDEAQRVIGQVAKLYGEKGGTLRVVGHASLRTKPMEPDRHAKVNEGISIARANAVVGQLSRLGVRRNAIVIDARGDSEPAYYEIMETGEAGNRRAEIYLEPNL